MLEILVNGKKHTVTAAAGTPLLYVLRNDLGLTGPKFGCGLGQCGACTVHMNGEAARSCRIPVETVGDKAVITLEGLGPEFARAQGGKADGHLHPVQEAFIEEQAAQCGYCTNGMIMMAAALVQKTPSASDHDVRKVMAGNLCRCGSHLRILRAIKRAAEAMG